MDLTPILVQGAFTLVFAAVLVGWFSRPASDPAEVGSFALGHGLDLTDRNLPMVTYYVRLAVTLRAIGGVSGLVLGALFDDATGLDTSAGPGFWIWILMGWLLGAGWAEYRLTRPRSADLAASLTPRAVRDYLPRGLLVAPAVGAAGCVALAVGRALAPEPSGASALHEAPVAAYAAGAAGAALIAALVRVAIRTVVARRQPVGPPDIVAADDAIRASAVHHLAGGGTAAILLIGAQMAFSATRPYDQISGAGFALTLLLLLGAFASWRWYAYRHWRVRRGQPAPSAS